MHSHHLLSILSLVAFLLMASSLSYRRTSHYKSNVEKPLQLWIMRVGAVGPLVLLIVVMLLW